MSFNKISGGQNLYPPMTIGLGPGETYIIPSGQGGTASTFGASQSQATGFTLSGQYEVMVGPYCCLQVYDSNLQTWRTVATYTGATVTISADNVNYRLANTTGCAVAALVTAGGTGLTNGFNTVTATQSAGGGTWNVIVGGAINPTLQLVAGGTSYTQRPILVCNPPSNQNQPYILPTAVAAITGGAISAVTVTNVGAGLVGNPTWTVLNAPGDTTGNGGSIASTAALAGSGTVTSVYTTGNYGTVGLTAVPTFTFSPASTITATAIMNFTITNISVTAAGAGYGNAQPVGVLVPGGQVGGSAALLTGNPLFDKSLIFPRQAAIEATSIASGAVGTAGQTLATTIHDAGYGFQKVPNVFPVPGGSGGPATTSAQLAAICGGQNDTCVLQPI